MKPEEVVLEELDKVMNKFIDRVFELSQLNLVNDGKIDTGTLLKTANINRRFLEKEIVYPATYAEFVEFGRNPGQMPPVDALKKWVRRKLGVPDSQVNSVSWAIVQAIKKRGIDPSPFLQPAITQARNEFKV